MILNIQPELNPIGILWEELKIAVANKSGAEMSVAGDITQKDLQL